MEIKKCTRCNQNKTVDNFNKNKRMDDGLDYYCRECRRETKKKMYRNHHTDINIMENIINLEGEVWKPVKGYENLYMISNMGRIKALSKIIFHGKFKTKLDERLLKTNLSTYGYYYLFLVKDGKKQYFSIHRLVALNFLDNPNNYPIVNHKDENPKNNRTDNLEWCTQKYNINYGTAMQRLSKAKSKTVYQYDKNMNFIKKWKSAKECGENGHVASGVSSCCKGKYKHHHGYIWSYTEINKEI